MKFEKLEKFVGMNESELQKVNGGFMTCTNRYGDTKVPTDGGKDTTTNPHDWLGFSDDGGGCPPVDTTQTQSGPLR